MKINDQYRIIHNPNDPDNTKVPSMPIVIVLSNGIVGEARTIRGALAIVAGSEYFDSEDSIDEWNFRVEIARKEAMIAMGRNIYAVVYDKRYGIIPENYAVDLSEEDYEPEEGIPAKIHVETDRSFLYSLTRIGAITLLEKEGSSILSNWEGQDHQKCENCQYKVAHENGFKCDVYNYKIGPEEGERCVAYYSESQHSNESSGGNYINVAEAYNLDELIENSYIE